MTHPCRVIPRAVSWSDEFVAAPVTAGWCERRGRGRPSSGHGQHQGDLEHRVWQALRALFGLARVYGGTAGEDPELVTIRSPIPDRVWKQRFIISEMKFPADRVRTRPLLTVMSATVLAGPYLTFGAATAAADDPPPPPLHQIHYTVWAEQPFTAKIYYRDVDPPNWAEYSHNPYLFSPKVDADVGPNQQWNLEVGLADPDQWAMVVAGTGGESQKKPNIHCALAVDGVVVKTNQGPKGALCSIRAW
jgi:hypothetical protein